MHGEGSFVPLLVVTSAAMVTGIILPRITILRIPVVVGEILFGIALGKSGVELIPVEPDPWLELLSLFGFTFLMFLSGLEINFRTLTLDVPGADNGGKKSGGMKLLLTTTFIIFGATLLLSFILSEGLVLLDYIESPWIMALIMSTTSVGLVMPLLKERGEADSPLGKVMIVSAVVADFVTMLLITVLVAFYEHDGPTLDVLVIGTLFVLFGAVVFAGRRLMNREGKLIKRLAFTAPKTAELAVRSAMTLMLGFVVFSQVIGSEIILGAFLAGAVVSTLSSRSVHGILGMKLDAIGFGFFIPIFFIMVGARFDIQSLLNDRASLALVPLLLAFAFAVKVLPTMLLSKFFGRRNAIAAGFLLSSRLSLIIAASAIGLRLGLITPEINTAIILVSIISCIASPLIYARLRPGGDSKTSKAVALDHVLSDVMGGAGGGHDMLQLIEVEAEHFPFLVEHSLAEAKLRQKTGLTLIILTRADGTVVDNPGGEFLVQASDRLVLIGTEAHVEKLAELGSTHTN